MKDLGLDLTGQNEAGRILQETKLCEIFSKNISRMADLSFNTRDEIRQEILEIENSIRLLRERLDHSDSQKGKAVLRGIVRILEIQRQEKVEEMLAFENNVLVNLQAHQINLELDHD